MEGRKTSRTVTSDGDFPLSGRRRESIAWGCKAYCVLPAPGQWAWQWALKGAATLIDARAPGQFPVPAARKYTGSCPGSQQLRARAPLTYTTPPPLACLASFPFFLLHLLFWDSTSFTSSSSPDSKHWLATVHSFILPGPSCIHRFAIR